MNAKDMTQFELEVTLKICRKELKAANTQIQFKMVA